MSDTKIEVTAVTVDKEFGQIHGNELHDNGVKTHDLIIYTTRAMAAKAIMAEETGASVFALMDSRGEITEVWSE